MSRRWENEEVQGRGTRYCLVIDPEDGTNPIRTYGWDKEEVLDKVAKTAETAQQVINRQRAEATAPRGGTPPTLPRVTADEQLQATNDLTNPAKAPDAIKTLLRAAGVNVDKIKITEDAQRVAAVAQEWERQNPTFPHDPRNQRLLLNTASKNVGFVNITKEALDAAFKELLDHDMIFDAASPDEPTEQPPTDAPGGNPATRVERPRATSYRANALRTNPATAARTNKPKYTRAEVDAMNSRQLGDKLDGDADFRDWYNREFSATA